MQEHGEVLADLLKAGGKHVVDGGTDDNPVPLFEGIAQQFITNSATDKICFHVVILTVNNLSEKILRIKRSAIKKAGHYDLPFYLAYALL